MESKKYKAVIFDFDETLVESRLVKWAQHKFVAKKHFNIDLTDEKILKHWGKPIHILAAEIYEHSDSWDNIHKILRSTKKDFPKKLYKNTIDTVNKIHDMGLRMGILSAATKIDVEEDLVKLGFPIGKIDAVQGAEGSEFHKPDPKVFLPILADFEKAGIKKEEIVYVGDSVDDYHAATGAGLGFIAITNGLYNEEEFKKLGASVIISNIKDVIEKVS